jgi:hypothetical protein
VLEVLDGGAGAGKENGPIAIVFPPNDVRGCSTRTMNLKNLSITVRFAMPMPVDDDTISHAHLLL